MSSATNPMEQFAITTIHPLSVFGQNVSFTNSALWMLIALGIVATFLIVGTMKPQMVPGRWQAAVEYMYDFVLGVVDENIGPKGKAYVPLIFSVFVFVLACNLLGMIPWVGSFTPTSHIAVTLALALIVFAIVLVVGFVKHGLHFLTFFWPKGMAWPLALFIMPIEVVSFFVRPFTLAIRLFANMTAGHVLLKVFGTFVVALGSFGALPYVFGVVPLAVNVALSALELLIALIQAYVFALLASIYLNDAINLH
ncbi:F0F1 ATP synthase subunit A [Stakelama sediminis]|uniref:ATP synthase subunit a n=1 Tax=Stakelama sediminis TaxID=463200 RepID=A0A840YVD5_9SPHN|nr:F0F1 ATP synthase subunit A [Stakelama sediminis]MBB5717608.1 F-type H+-transporting ATPase subunit a [Stakelama sediminis]